LIYFDTIKDKKRVEEFLPLAVEFWEFEKKMGNSRRNRIEERVLEHYKKLRKNIARKTPQIIHISRRAGIPDVLHSYPAPAVGGPVIPVNIYESILNDDSHGHIPNQRKLDTLNKLIGQLDGKIEFEFRKVINPFFWFGLLIEKIVRTPFWLLSKTGFEISKIEDHFLGKLFKLIEILALLYISLRLGLPEDWIKTLLGGVGK
jgi:hypothetical protein